MTGILAAFVPFGWGMAAPAPAGSVPVGAPPLLERVLVESEPLDYVELDFVVSDREGRPVSGLAPSEFSLRVDGLETDLESVEESRGERAGARSIALLLDTSGSMRALDRPRFMRAAESLLEQLQPADEMTILTFAESCQVLGAF